MKYSAWTYSAWKNSTHGIILFSLTIFLLLTNIDTSGAEDIPCRAYETVNITREMKGDSVNPSISGDGSKIIFDSSVGMTDENPEGTYQIFVYDKSTRKTEQITDFKDEGSVSPQISADGAKMAFVTGADVQGKNPEGLNLIYLYDFESGEFEQITKSGQSFEPSLNYDGSQLVFTSNMGSGEGVSNIFIYDGLSDTETNITNSIKGLNVSPQISGDGKFVVYESSEDLTGKTQIKIYDAVSGASVPIEVTDTTVGSLSPTISKDGGLAAFESDSDANGNNPHKTLNIYTYDTFKKELRQITNEPQSGSAGPSLSGDGSTLVFQSSGNFSGQNPEGNIEIFAYDIESGKYSQVTDNGAGQRSTGALISGDGKEIVFLYDDTSLKDNPGQHSDIYLASCKEDINIGGSPDFINWIILAAAAGLSFILLVKYRKNSG